MPWLLEKQHVYKKRAIKSKSIKVNQCVAKGGEEGAARPGCHHLGMAPFYGTNRTKKTTICLISEMFSTLEWTKNDLKNLLKHIFL